MWPTKTGLGVQLSYGVDGNLFYIDQFGEEEKPWNIPRERSSGLQLHKVHRSHKRLVPATRSSFDLDHSLNEQFQALDEEIYVPNEILQSYLIESKTLISNSVYDPTVGTLFEVGEVKKSKSHFYRKILAYATGSTGSTLNISYVLEKMKNVKASHVSIDIPVPYLEPSFSLKFNSPIKQIEFAKLVPTLESCPPYIAVRTDESVYILKITINLHDSIDLEVIGEVMTSEFKHYSFADVSFNPWDFTQIGMIDVKGNFGILNIKEKRLKKLNKEKLENNSIYDVAELSNWKRISWGSNFHSILLFSRSSIYSYDLNTMEKTKCITANRWSTIQDFQRCSNNSKFGFILTSKELIWVELSSPVKRLMSWKHFLDDSDPSLQLHLPNMEASNGILCMIYSQTHSLIFIYQFDVVDGLCKSINDPYFILSSFTTTTQNIILAPLKRKEQTADITNDYSTLYNSGKSSEVNILYVMEISTQLEISISLYSNSDNLSFGKDSADIPESTDTDRSPSPIPSNQKHFNKFRRVELEDLAQQLLEKPDVIPQSEYENVALIQEFAYQLSEVIKSLPNKGLDESFSHILNINIPERINDFEELDSMLEQMRQYFESKGTSFKNLATSFVSSDATGMAFLHKVLLDYFENSSDDKSRQSIINSTIPIGLSFLRFSNSLEFSHQDRISKQRELLPEELQAIFDTWENYADDSDDEVVDERLTQRVATQELPIINISQSQSRSLNNSQSQSSSQSKRISRNTSLIDRRKIMASSSSLARINEGSRPANMSQRIPSFSQSQDREISTFQFGSSQVERGRHGDRRKKKRKGGFA